MTRPRLAYLTSLYPAVSHTFIQREVAALRDLGFAVVTCSIRRPGAAHLTGPEEREACAGTFYILAGAARALLPALGLALCRPGRLLGVLGLAWRTAPPGLEGMARQAAYLAEALILARHLRAQGIAHLHNHFADPSANVAMLASALSGVPFSYTLHGPAELYEPEKWQLREKTARAAFVACISHFARAQAMYFSDPAQWHKLRIVHCGVLPERYDRPAPPRPEGETRLVFVGRLTAIKGLRVLIEAFAAARASRPGLVLTLIGDGDDRAHLERLAAPLGDAVRFAGFQSQEGVAAALAEADAMVLPSFAEGLPVVLMEALASARPVIATQVAGVSELVEEGVSGFLVPAGDAETLADRIGRLADDPALRARMGAAGRARVRAEFDARTEAARIGALIAGTGGTAPRPAPLAAPAPALASPVAESG
jgi:glycosyltransferase involved in cell wall biosynthesis